MFTTGLHLAGRAQTVTYTGKSVSLQELFKVIRQQTNYKFFYSSKDLEGAAAVTVHWNNTPVKSALENALAGQPLEFEIQNKTIFISRRQAT
ncbi:MAG TPA: STN domain-containing protein, partial [Chitinophaga sp.]